MKIYTFILVMIMAPVLAGAALQQGQAQITQQQQQQIDQEFRRRNITEAELRQRLMEKGIDLDAIPPEELPNYQSIIMQTVMELEMEKQQQMASDTAFAPQIGSITLPDPDDPIRDTVTQVPVPPTDPGIYGHSLFADRNLDVFRTTEGARAPDTYLLGPGDQVRITIFGDSQIDLLLEINNEGYVRPEDTPQIYLKGLTIVQARALLTRRLSQFYTFRTDQFALTIQTARTITINIFGETNTRGSFTISALNTAFNALAAAGGPTSIGSIRNIQHIRGNERRTLDVYAFMHDPAVKFDFDLQHNDIIYVPVSDKLVRISGAVKRPLRYELTQGENLVDLIAYAGGINYDTYPDYLQIERIEDGELTLREWSLADALSGDVYIGLQDGDVVRLRQVEKPLARFVEIDGAIFYPGRYDLRQNPTLSALIERTQLRPQAKTDLLFIERVQPDESVRILPIAWDEVYTRGEQIGLEARDRVRVFDQERYRSLATIAVTGNVREPFERSLPYDERMTLAHALSLAGGARPTAADLAYVIRTNLMNPDILEHFPVNLVQDWNFMLQPGDQLMVYTQSTYTNIPQVSIQGAVNNPFTTRFETELNITDLLKMAGGFTEKAAKNRVDIFRMDLSMDRGTTFDRFSLEVDSTFNLLPGFEDFSLMPYDQIVVRQIPQFDVDRSAQISGEAMYPGPYPLETRRVHLSEFIRKSGGITSQADTRNAMLLRSFEGIGPVAINLEKALANPGKDRYDPVIMAGDVITIPKFQNIVAIRLEATRLGELEQRGILVETEFIPGSMDEMVTFIFQGAHSAKWYIENFAGGFASDADRNSVTVINRSGQVVGTRRPLGIFRSYPTVEPGSTISLAYEPPKPEEGKPAVDWERMQQRALTSATTILTLIAIIDRLSR